jgi:hypothetical protein
MLTNLFLAILTAVAATVASFLVLAQATRWPSSGIATCVTPDTRLMRQERVDSHPFYCEYLAQTSASRVIFRAVTDLTGPRIRALLTPLEPRTFVLPGSLSCEGLPVRAAEGGSASFRLNMLHYSVRVD